MKFEVLMVIALVVVAASHAYRRGGPPERFAAIVIAALVLSDVTYHLLFGPSGFEDVDPFHVVIDCAELAAIMWLALYANRIWPLFAAAAQLLSVTGHMAVLVEPDGMRRAYWAMTQLPQYIQLVALLAGATAHTRRVRLFGPYRSWRTA